MTKHLLLLTCAVGAISGSIGVSAAFAAPPADSTASPSATEVGAVIVTAEKRQQNLQKVPIAVTAFTSKQRDLLGIENLQDMTNFTPGLTYSSALDRVTLRGIGRQTNLLSSEAAVATYVDGFFTTSAVEAAKPPMFIQSVDVLRGPQGTLQGRNSIGGALLVTTAQPSSTPHAEGRLTVGNYGYSDIEAYVTGPIADGLNFRLQGYTTNQTQGYFHNVAGGPSEGNVLDQWYIEPSLKAKLGDNADLYVKAFAANWNNRGGPGARTGYDSGNYGTAINDISEALFFNPAAVYGPNHDGLQNINQNNPNITGSPSLTNVRDFSSNTPLTVKLRNSYDFDTEFTYHFPGIDFKYTGGFQSYKYDLSEDYDGTDVNSYQIPGTPGGACTPATCLTVFPTEIGFYEERNQWFSHEVTFASTTNNPLQWIVGGYYYDERYSNPQGIQTPDQPQVFTPVAGPANPSGDLDLNTYQMETRSEAVYGQLDWKVTPTIKLTAGLRYTSDYKQGEEEERVIAFGGSIGGPLDLLAAPLNFIPTVAQLPPAYGGLAFAPLGAATPAVDLTPSIAATCAGLASGNKGIKSNCSLNAAGDLTRTIGGTSSAVTGTAGVEWTPTDTALGYFRYSRGYKAFGLNAGNLSAFPETDPEYINDFELGWKQTFGRNLVVDADVYYYDYQNMQVPVSTKTSSGLVQSLLDNIPKARADGFELETIWTPVNHLQFNLTYSYEDTAILTGCNPSAKVTGCFIDTETAAGYFDSTAISIKNDSLPNAPKNKVSLNGNYTILFDQGSLNLSATYIWRDQTYGGIFKDSADLAPSWDQVDLRATWKAPDDKYEVVLFGRNVFNSAGYEAAANGIATGNAAVAANPGLGLPALPGTFTAHNVYGLNPPATYGVELHYKFF